MYPFHAFISKTLYHNKRILYHLMVYENHVLSMRKAYNVKSIQKFIFFVVCVCEYLILLQTLHYTNNNKRGVKA